MSDKEFLEILDKAERAIEQEKARKESAKNAGPKAMKLMLEENIHLLLFEFERETGLCVEDVIIRRIPWGHDEFVSFGELKIEVKAVL